MICNYPQVYNKCEKEYKDQSISQKAQKEIAAKLDFLESDKYPFPFLLAFLEAATET